MMAEFAHYYGGFPRPEDPWPLVLDAITKTPRFEARRQLTGFDAVRAAIGVAFSGGSSGDRMRHALAKAAYPVKVAGGAGDDLLPNLAAEEGADDA